jgi:hypothetical protein
MARTASEIDVDSATRKPSRIVIKISMQAALVVRSKILGKTPWPRKEVNRLSRKYLANDSSILLLCHNQQT